MDEIELVRKHHGEYIRVLLQAGETLAAQRVTIAAFREAGVI